MSPHPSSPQALTRLATRRLRLFRYVPPAGGFGGDWDVLTGRIDFTDEAELQRILAILGYTGTPPLGPQTTDLPDLRPGGFRPTVQVTREPSFMGDDRRNSIGLLFAIYVSPETIEEAARFEAWLETQGVALPSRST